MPQITYIVPDGKRTTVEAPFGTVMEAAVDNGIEGIDADCGGVCSCATCHVHVAREWMARVGPPGVIEQDTLTLAEGVDERSRLSCQIDVTDELDGLVVEVAKS